jgi:hypothetical protein
MSPATNSYPFKDTLFEFIKELERCNLECDQIRKNRHGADSSKSLRSLQRHLSSYAAALSDEYNYHHTGRIGSRIETGDSIAIFDIEKAISQLRTYVFSPLNKLSIPTGHKQVAGFTDIKDTAVTVCEDVYRVIDYLAERLIRKSTPDVYRDRDSYTPPYTPAPARDPYYTTAPARTVYAPHEYYGAAPAPLYTPQPQSQPQYVAVRDPYGGVVLVRARRHRR